MYRYKTKDSKPKKYYSKVVNNSNYEIEILINRFNLIDSLLYNIKDDKSKYISK